MQLAGIKSIITFIGLSLALHLSLMLVELSPSSNFELKLITTVGYVQRPLAQFYRPRVSSTQLSDQSVPEVADKQLTELESARILQRSIVEPIESVSPETKPLQKVKLKKQKPPEEIVSQLPRTAEEHLTSRLLEPPAAISHQTPASEPMVFGQEVTSSIGAKKISPAGDLPEQSESTHSATATVLSLPEPAANLLPPKIQYQGALPRYDVNPPPKYPRVARLRGIEGSVKLTVQVLSSGRVKQAKVSESSGHRSLDRAAQQTVRRWLFKPAISNGLPVASQVDVPIDFVLNQ